MSVFLKHSENRVKNQKTETMWAWPLAMTPATYCFRASILSSSVCLSSASIHSSNRSHESSFCGILLRKSWRMKGERLGLVGLHHVLVSSSSPCLVQLRDPLIILPQAAPPSFLHLNTLGKSLSATSWQWTEWGHHLRGSQLQEHGLGLFSSEFGGECTVSFSVGIWDHRHRCLYKRKKASLKNLNFKISLLWFVGRRARFLFSET